MALSKTSFPRHREFVLLAATSFVLLTAHCTTYSDIEADPGVPSGNATGAGSTGSGGGAGSLGVGGLAGHGTTGSGGNAGTTTGAGGQAGTGSSDGGDASTTGGASGAGGAAGTAGATGSAGSDSDGRGGTTSGGGFSGAGGNEGGVPPGTGGAGGAAGTGGNGGTSGTAGNGGTSGNAGIDASGGVGGTGGVAGTGGNAGIDGGAGNAGASDAGGTIDVRDASLATCTSYEPETTYRCVMSAPPACGTNPVNCGATICPANSSCGGGNVCVCNANYLAVGCSNGLKCSSSAPCTGGQWGCLPKPDPGCTGNPSQTEGVCNCSDGKAYTLSCGSTITCDQRCRQGS